MAANSKIEWCHHSFNIAWGCTKVSPGCANRYADTLSHRYGFDVWGQDKERRTFGEKHWREPLAWDKKGAAAGERHRVFCSSMCDVFEAHPTIDSERTKLWSLIRQTENLDWLLLTKRADRMADICSEMGLADRSFADLYPNVWLGVSVENQQHADERIPHLLRTSAAVRFLSCEPLLGRVNLRLGSSEGLPTAAEPFRERANLLHWVIIGGESGPGARPMVMDWALSIIQQCDAGGIPVFMKQVGSNPVFEPGMPARGIFTSVWGPIKDAKGGMMGEWPPNLRVRQFPEVPRG